MRKCSDKMIDATIRVVDGALFSKNQLNRFLSGIKKAFDLKAFSPKPF
ncbi:hypothetical protein M3084_10485 [Succinatimonas hippei]|nr:hypothetical protein [Succinatimonas hippei]MCL1604267.1 hypothetical protein [Succinatimonas hippei]